MMDMGIGGPPVLTNGRNLGLMPCSPLFVGGLVREQRDGDGSRSSRPMWQGLRVALGGQTRNLQRLSTNPTEMVQCAVL